MPSDCLPVAIYLRISDDPYKLRAGVTRQRADCLALASSRWPDHPTVTFEDNDLSSSRYAKKPRPAYETLCRGIEGGELHAVVGWDFDRLFRNPRELEQFLDLADRQHFTRALTAQGDVDLTTNDGRLHARIMVAVAAKESDDKSRRIRRVIRDKQEGGRHDGKSIVYGYKLVEGEPIVVPDQAKVVRHVATLVLSGTSLAQCARSMPPGAPQTAQGVRRMLLSSTLIARNTAGVRGTWTPILTDSEGADVRALLLDPARSINSSRGKRRWWLSGLVWCQCNGRLKVKNDGTGIPSYVCYQGCNTIGIRAKKLHAHMELELFAAVKALEPVAQQTGSQVSGDNDGISETDSAERLSELAVLYATGAITRAEWTAARDVVTTVAIHDPQPSHVLAPVPDLPARWDSWTPTERHHQATRVLERVVIHRASVRGQWEPSRVKPQWKVQVNRQPT